MSLMCPKTCNYCPKTIKRPGCNSNYGCCNDGISPKQKSDNCKKYKSVCDMPLNTGKCLGNLKRFYFDQDSNDCVEFSMVAVMAT